MSPEAPGPEERPELSATERAKRRRRLAEVFGDVLPEQTRDDAADPRSQVDGAEEWLRRQVPPPHGQ